MIVFLKSLFATTATLFGAACFWVCGSSAVAVAGPASALTFSPGIQPVYREIGDWLIACDNTRQCVAKYVLGDHDDAATTFDADASIEISRDAGSTGTVEVKLSSGWIIETNTIRIDATGVQASLWAKYDEGRGATIVGAGALAAVRALRNAKIISWSGNGHASTVSLKGLTAVLIAMDEAQGRIGAVTALGRPGPHSASSVPPPVAPPVAVRGARPSPLMAADQFLRTVRRQQASALKKHECDQDAGSDDSADPLDAGNAIVLLGCGRFAYQTSVLAFIVPRAHPAMARPLILPDLMSSSSSDPDSIGEYVGGSYDADTRVFSQYAKGRGPADCGSSAEWTFDGKVFRISSFAMQQRCGGEAGDWPTLYRTRVLPAR